MTNTILRLEKDPDTGKDVEIYMSDEEWKAAFDPKNPNPQILRDKITEMKTTKISKQSDLETRITELEKIIDEMRKQK